MIHFINHKIPLYSTIPHLQVRRRDHPQCSRCDNYKWMSRLCCDSLPLHDNCDLLLSIHRYLKLKKEDWTLFIVHEVRTDAVFPTFGQVTLNILSTSPLNYIVFTVKKISGIQAPESRLKKLDLTWLDHYLVFWNLMNGAECGCIWFNFIHSDVSNIRNNFLWTDCIVMICLRVIHDRSYRSIYTSY